MRIISLYWVPNIPHIDGGTHMKNLLTLLLLISLIIVASIVMTIGIKIDSLLESENNDSDEYNDFLSNLFKTLGIVL